MRKDIILTITVSLLILLAGTFPMPAYSSSAESMDINDFEGTMSVGSSQTINVALYPEDAEDTILYYSSNTSVATVSQGGKIEAKSAGTTDITISAGGAIKTMTLTVSVLSKDISLNSTFITLKPGENFTLKGKVSPSDAVQKLTFKSSDTSVAKVSSKGVIKAVGLGSASIIVSNSDLTVSADVIVNNSSSDSGTMYFGTDEAADAGNDGSQSLQGGSLNAEKLRMFQKTGNTLTIEKEDYVITLKGSDIVNPDNGLDGEFHIVKNDDGYTFSVGSGDDFLPGKITVLFRDAEMCKCKYVYLKDKSSNKYQLFSELSGSSFETDVAGNYQIAYEKLKSHRPDLKIILIAGAAIVAVGGIYLILRKELLIF